MMKPLIIYIQNISSEFRALSNLKSLILRRSRFNQSLVSIQAFTLIELLVVITIATLLFGLGYANYRNFAQRQALNAIARTIEADIRRTQNYASSAKIPSGCSILDGYKITFVPDTVSYSAVAICGGNQNGDAVISQSFGSEIYSMSVQPSDPILFKSIGNGTDIPDNVSTVIITITNTKINSSININISRSGEVSIGG